jgi:hypothetical protein
MMTRTLARAMKQEVMVGVATELFTISSVVAED